MKINFSQLVTGAERKVIAAIIGKAIEKSPVYAGPPSFSYTVGDWVITKDGTVVSPQAEFEDVDSIKAVIAALAECGLQTKGTLTITVHDVAESDFERLGAVIRSKELLLCKALRSTGKMHTTYTEGRTSFDYLTPTLDSDLIGASLTLIAKLVDFSINLKYSSATEHPVENEKYAFRCFLLRLGFIGTKYKSDRKVLLTPFTGNTAFKHNREEAVTE